MPQSLFNVFYTQRRGAQLLPQVRVIPPQGPVKRFVKSLCLDVKCVFKRIKLAL